MGISHQPNNPTLVSGQALLVDQLCEELTVGPVLASRLLGSRQVVLPDRRQAQLLQLIRQLRRVDRRR